MYIYIYIYIYIYVYINSFRDFMLEMSRFCQQIQISSRILRAIFRPLKGATTDRDLTTTPKGKHFGRNFFFFSRG